MRALVRIFIRSYQIVISPALSFLGGPHSGCRFAPTCSEYFLQAVEVHGLLRGGFWERKGCCVVILGVAVDLIPCPSQIQWSVTASAINQAPLRLLIPPPGLVFP